MGVALARRLLEEAAEGGRRVRVCLACRNMEKARGARESLLAEYPEAQVDVLKIDTSSPSSVKAAAREIQRRYRVGSSHLSSPFVSVTAGTPV